MTAPSTRPKGWLVHIVMMWITLAFMLTMILYSHFTREDCDQPSETPENFHGNLNSNLSAANDGGST